MRTRINCYEAISRWVARLGGADTAHTSIYIAVVVITLCRETGEKEMNEDNEAILVISEEDNGDINVRLSTRGDANSLPALLGTTLYELTKDTEALTRITKAKGD